MKRPIVKTFLGAAMAVSLLTACGNRNAIPVETQEAAVFSDETGDTAGTVSKQEPVYRVREETHFNNDGSDAYALRFQYEYDADGNRVKRTAYGSSENNGNWSEYEYTDDGNGYHVRETTYSQYGAKTHMDYSYNARGDMTERAYYRGNNLIRTRFFSADGKDCITLRTLYQMKAAADKNEVLYYIGYDNDVVTEFAMACYDADGNRIAENIFFADGSLMYAYEYDYDADGNMTKLSVRDANGTLLNEGRFEYLCDEDGNILEQREYSNGEFVVLVQYDYAYI
ncbi:MAG: hypothetical protein NC337_07120 [Roseburia sp.]|nr:hypothetical protein [Roseburia sp.]